MKRILDWVTALVVGGGLTVIATWLINDPYGRSAALFVLLSMVFLLSVGRLTYRIAEFLEQARSRRDAVQPPKPPKPPTEEQKILDFMEEMTSLAKKYQIVIYGRGGYSWFFTFGEAAVNPGGCYKRQCSAESKYNEFEWVSPDKES